VQPGATALKIFPTQNVQDSGEGKGVGDVDGVPMSVHFRRQGVELDPDGGGKLVLHRLEAMGYQDFCSP
jgi:hypothetical protein